MLSTATNFKKVLLKWVGEPCFWEGLVDKMEKWSFFQGLVGTFPGCPSHIRTLYFTLFLTKLTPPNLKKAQSGKTNCIFGKFQTVPSSLPSPYFRA